MELEEPVREPWVYGDARNGAEKGCIGREQGLVVFVSVAKVGNEEAGGKRVGGRGLKLI